MFFLWFNGFLVICKNIFFSFFQLLHYFKLSLLVLRLRRGKEVIAIEEEASVYKMETKTMLLQLLLCNMEVSVYKSALTLCLYHLDLLLVLKAL